MSEPYNPGIDGGVRTVHSDGRPVTFTNPSGKLLLTIDLDGSLTLGPSVAKDTAARAVADMILAYFGRAYGSALVAAEAEAEHAQSQLRRITFERNDLRDRIVKAEKQFIELSVRGP